MVGLYFSGTGNTKHCVKEFVKHFDDNSCVVSIEAPEAAQSIEEKDLIVFGYPVYFSNMPKIVRDFITQNRTIFCGKKIFIIATMGLFSGDGAGCAARLLRKYGAEIIGGLHLKMPDCIGDEKALKRTAANNRAIIKQANSKIHLSAQKFREGNPNQEGLSIFHHAAGLLGQRLWFYGKTSSYKAKPDINIEKCIGCGLCAKVCPMSNLATVRGKARQKARCTLCYRCFSQCPTKALTILGKKVHEQYLFENYQ